MDNDPKQTTNTGDNTNGDPTDPIQALLAHIEDNNNAILQVSAVQKKLERIAEYNWNEELEKLHEKHPNLSRWELLLVAKSPDFAAEFLPRYQNMLKEWDKKIEDYNKWLTDIDNAITKTYDGKAWVDLLCEHPEFADKCDWSKLTDEDWSKLLEKQPQFADKRGK